MDFGNFPQAGGEIADDIYVIPYGNAFLCARVEKRSPDQSSPYAFKRRRIVDLGVRNLLGAMLLLAVQDYLGQRKKLPNERREPSDDAERYLFNNDRDYLLSFVNVCEVLRIDPEGIRRELRRRKLSKNKPQVRLQTALQLFRVSSFFRESGVRMSRTHSPLRP